MAFVIPMFLVTLADAAVNYHLSHDENGQWLPKEQDPAPNSERVLFHESSVSQRMFTV